MSDAVFREKKEAEIEKQELPEGKTLVASPSSEVETPFTDYHSQNGRPFLVDYFNLGEYWNDPAGGFECLRPAAPREGLPGRVGERATP